MLLIKVSEHKARRISRVPCFTTYWENNLVRRESKANIAGMDQKIFIQLREVLQARHEIIADHDHRDRDPAGHLERLKTVSLELERLEQQLPPDTDPHLRHFLQRRSYEKALAQLGGPSCQ